MYAPDDEGALHTREAGRVERVASYLDPAEITAAAARADADAVHPGYGFLAESPALAEAVTAAGLTWVGPPPDVLRSAGDKLEAKRIAAGAGVPVVETGTPEEVGFPLDHQGRRGRRGTRHARRPLAGGAGRGGGGGEARGRGRLRRRHGVLRALRRAAAARRDPAPRRRARDRDLARRARLLRAAPPPEGRRGEPIPRRGRGAARRDGGRRRSRSAKALGYEGAGRRSSSWARTASSASSS